MAEKHYLSKEKYKELEQELENLKTVKRKEIAETLSYARSLGDLSENAEYHDARNQQAEIESRIEIIENTLKYAEIVKAHKSDVAEVGSTITIKKKKGDQESIYELVGEEEANIMENKLSYNSPMGQAMLGKAKGDEFSFETPKGKVDYIVVDIK